MIITFLNKVSVPEYAQSTYLVETNTLKTKVRIMQYENEEAFMQSISEGNQKEFHCFNFWNTVRLKVLKFHNDLNNDEKERG